MAEEKEDDKAAAGWWGIVLRRGWQVGKRVAVAGAAITAAPVVAPPLLLLSTLGLALAFPFTLYLASFACADKLMSSLLPLPQEPMQQEAYSEQGDEDEDGDDEIPRSYPSMAAANDESRQNTEIFVEEEETLSNKDGDEGDLNEEDGTIHQLAENQEFSEQSSGPPLSAGDGEIEIKEDEKGESGEGEEEEEKGGEAGQLGGNAVLQTDINGRSEEKQSGVMRDGDGGGLDEEKKEEDSVDAAVVTESERATKIMSEKRPIERDLGKREEVGENDDAGKHDGEMPPSEIEIEIEPSGLSSEYASAVEDSSPDVA